MNSGGSGGGGGGGGGGVGGGLEARRLLEIAEKLLDARDLVGSKRFAERALESDPLLNGVDQILAIVDVLLASQRRIHDQIDYYSVLQIPHPSPSNSSAASDGGRDEDSLAIKRSYGRLAILLSPDKNMFPLADSALRFVTDAFAFLSDPAKKSLLDAQIQVVTPHLRSNGTMARQPDRSFWTCCTSCCHVFEYERAYLNRTLRCRICQRPFHAGEMEGKPPIVPGTDMYYCAWGFFPLGFRGGPDAAGGSEFGDGWKPFYPMSPWWGNKRAGQPEKPLNAVPVSVAAVNPHSTQTSRKRGKRGPYKKRTATKIKKPVAKKRVGNYSRRKISSAEIDSRSEGAEVRVGTRGTEADAPTGVGISNFDIDLDATEDVLGNLPNLPFLREEDIQIQLP